MDILTGVDLVAKDRDGQSYSVWIFSRLGRVMRVYWSENSAGVVQEKFFPFHNERKEQMK